MKYFFWMLLFAGWSFNMAAQQEFKPMVAQQEFKQKYRDACRQITSLQCRFEQTKEISFLKDKLKSNGELFFRSDQKLKIAYRKPNEFVFILDGDKTIVKDGDHAASSVSLKGNKLFQQISQVTMNMIDGKIFDSKGFTFELFENASQFMIKAVPSTKELKQYYTELNLYGAKNSFMVERVVMKEVSGDITTMIFGDIEANKTLNDAVFVVR